MSRPDYLICLECDTPTYVFEWRDDQALEALCELCGNDELEHFVTSEELDEMADSYAFQNRSSRRS